MGGKRGTIFLSVFAILLILNISIFVNANFDCGLLSTGYKCSSYYDSELYIDNVYQCLSWCENYGFGSGMNCCDFRVGSPNECSIGYTRTSVGGTTYSASTCSYYVPDQCSSGVCCNTALNPNQFYPSGTICPGTGEVRWICQNQQILLQTRGYLCSGSSSSCGTTLSPWTTETVYDTCEYGDYYCTEGQTSSTSFGCTAIPKYAAAVNPTYTYRTSTTPGSCSISSGDCGGIDINGVGYSGVESMVSGFNCVAGTPYGCTHRTSTHSCFLHNCLTGTCPSGFPFTSCPTWGASYPKGISGCEGDSQGGGTGCDWIAWGSGTSSGCSSGSSHYYFKDADNDGCGAGTGYCLCGPQTIGGVTYKVTNANDYNDAVSGCSACVCASYPHVTCTAGATCSYACASGWVACDGSMTDGDGCETSSSTYTGCSGTGVNADVWSFTACGAALSKITDCSDWCLANYGSGYTSSCNPGPPATCVCTRTGYCGDGDIVAPEACDDGNTASGDGCAYSSCTIEPGYTCSGEPSVCKKGLGQSCTYGDQCVTDYCIEGTCQPGCSSDGRRCSTTTASYTSYGICAGGTCDTSGAALSSGTYYSSCSGRSDNTPADTNSLAGGYSQNGYCCGGGFSSSACCTNACTLGATQCSGSSIQTCITGGSGCTVWGTATSCADANSCTTDSCSGGSCTHTAISGCCTTNSQCNDGSVCTNDYCSSNTCHNDAISGCCTSSSQCNDGSACTTDSCSSNTCYNTADVCSSSQTCISGTCTTCAINSVSISPSSGVDDGETVTISVSTNSACNGKTVNLYIRNSGGTVSTLSPIIISSSSGSRNWVVDVSSSGNYYARATLAVNSGITRDSSNVYITYTPPATCPNGVCGSGETCSNCIADCPCTGGTVCQSGSCVVPCDLTNAYWSTSSTTSGNTVSLTAIGNSGCNGKTISFEVRKDNTVGTEYVANPSSQTMSSGTVTTTWTAIAPFSGDTTPLYFFIASYGSETFDSRDGSGNDRLDVSIAVTCGNSALNAGEGCDDGDTSSGDGCSSSCQVESGYECDNSPMPSTCTRSCGDGTLDSGETCDDGDTSSGDGCSSTCTVESGYTCTGAPSVCTLTCGNSILNTGEACDDGDTSSGDGCSSTCTIEGGYVCDNSPMPSTCTLTCPNGVCSGETCSTCPQDCGACITCGNAVLNAGETCDDADSESGDGCSSSCLIEGGYECDNSPMPSTCTRSCGDSGLDSGEECDDGNINNNDGCSSSCTVEEDWVCDNSPMPSVCDKPNLCAISSASWSSTTNIEEGDSVHLNIETANCDNGETVTFRVLEDDATGQDDLTETLTATINNNAASAIWVTEYQEDTESNFLQAAETNPPEYYFEVIVDSIGESSKATSSMTLTVHEDGSLYCIINTINTCADYDEANCEIDSCSRGESSQGPGTKCGLSFEEETRCLLDTVCGCEWNELTSSCTNYFDETYVGGGCVVCGNGIKDYTEQCDDGNALSGDGCYNCTLEDNIDPPCGPGLTLCSDNTCSYRCDITDEEVADCNYDGVCQAGTEGCNCADCEDEQDTCVGGLICSLSDLACCNPTNDDVCNLYCVTIDPDCENDNTECGNGLKEFDEQCDDGNVVSEDGCSMICQYETLPGPPDAPCPEGTTLCSDGTCSLNCWFTDEGYGDCTDSSCCAIGLLFSSFDSACCNILSNGVCNPYCTYIDPDCSGMGTISISSIGKCVFDKTGSTDDCSDGYLTRDYTADWQWDTTNVFFTNPNPLNNRYVEDAEVPGIWHYDPLDVNGVRKSAGCQGIHDTIPCPAQIKLNAFGKTHLIIGFLIIGIVYTIIIFRRKK